MTMTPAPMKKEKGVQTMGMGGRILGAARGGLSPTLVGLAALLVLGAARPDWSWFRAARNPDSQRGESGESDPAGYYVGLIEGADSDSGRDGELARRLWGGPTRPNVEFTRDGFCHYPPGDFRLHELLPNVSRTLLGRPFHTNSVGLRDREYEVAKPEGVFRVALLGASIEMGWGVDDESTYANRFEDWLNHRAERLGLDRRFEVINFGVAAYGPPQRLDTLVNRVRAYEPDLVICAANLIDTRLMELHLRELMRGSGDLKYPFLERIAAEAGLTARDAGDKRRFKNKLQPRAWDVVRGSFAEMSRICGEWGVPFWVVIVPRATEADGPSAREATEACYVDIFGDLGIPYLNLLHVFDAEGHRRFRAAPGDDHPNEEGHRRFFLEMGRQVVDRPELGIVLFGNRGSEEPVSGSDRLPR